MTYEPNEIEKKWQDKWEEANLYNPDLYDFSKPKYYVMDMFPYPSAQGLHVGHIEGYTASDAMARFKRAQGYNVFHPMGFDSFGLPAEQYAIKTNNNPKDFTEKNIDNFKTQMRKCGLSYSTKSELHTSSPEFYKWTQWIFLKLYDNDLAYEDNGPVNYCPELGTVLANEEVIDGKSERGGFPVIKMQMKQWVLKITAYAQKLLDDLVLLDWPSSTVEMQRNWIGRSEGVEITFDVKGSEDSFKVYTTRVDTLFGCTYVVLAPEHPLVNKLTTPECQENVDKYLDSIKSKSDLERTELNKDKTGVFIGSYAINPINGKEVPIFIGDYVLASYGSGAVMAVPTHDQRDYEFAKKHNLPLVQVLEGDVTEHAFEGDAKHINSDFANGMNIAEAKEAITLKLEELKKGTRKVNFKLRDWLFSRQRYWGEPIPMVHMEDGSLYRVKDEDLPLVIPELDDYKPTNNGKPPLSKAKSFVEVCIDGKKGERETNIMPQWAGSSWYYIRYLDPHNNNELADKKLIDHWLPVDLYIGGAEHAVLHLLYARFWHKFLYDQGIVSSKEPFKKLVHQGMVLGSDGQKMSKSRGNVVNPDDVIREYGADALRLYELFKGPIDQSLPWSDNGLAGAKRFIQRVYRLFTDEEMLAKIVDKEVTSLDYVYNYTIKKVTDDFEILHFNTAISQIMIYVNELYSAKEYNRKHLMTLIKLLSPVVPHVAQELYEISGEKGFIDFTSWPTYDESKLVKNEVVIAVSINGKTKATIEINKDENDQEKVLAQAKELEIVKRNLENKTIVKVIFVKNKILNIVVK